MKMTLTLRTMLLQGLELNADNPAIIEGERQYTFRELDSRTRRMGNALFDLGLVKGDRVAFLSHNSIESAESYFSIPNAGLVLVMLNYRLSSAEILAVLADSQPRVLMINEEYTDQLSEIKNELTFIEHFIFIGSKTGIPDGWHHYETLIERSSPLEPEVKVRESDIAALIYTSGTTGSSKGCIVIHSNLYHIGRGMAREMSLGRDDIAIIPAPLFHAAGIVVLMYSIYSGTTSVIVPRWNVEEFIRLVEKYHITTGMIATPMLQFIVNHPQVNQNKFKTLKKLLFAGAPVTPIVFEKAIQRFGNIFIHCFGTTETVGTLTLLRTEAVEKATTKGEIGILGSCGKPIFDMEVEIVNEQDDQVPLGDVGEIRARGLGMTQGYWKNEDETRASFKNGWYYTGDLGRLDEHGFMYVVGRKSDMIITGGENVFPAEVESVLYKHPSIDKAAVIGIDDEIWGESITAFIVKKDDMSVSENKIKNFCRKEIAGYKVPKKVIFIKNLPFSATGKLLKRKLKELLILENQSNGSEERRW